MHIPFRSIPSIDAANDSRARRVGSCRSLTIVVGFAVMGAAGPLRAHPGHLTPLWRATASEVAPAPAGTRGVPADARISVTVVDAKTGQPTAVRVRVTDERGRAVGLPGSPAGPAGGPAELRLAAPGTVAGLPAEAIGVMYGPNDSAQGYAFQPDGAFYVRGSFDLALPAGRYFLTLSKGYEYIRETHEVVLRSGGHVARSYSLRRSVDLPERGWYSADDHIHLRRSPRENPLILDWIAAEDVHVGVILQMGDFWTTYFSQYAWGRAGRYGAGGYILTSGQEEPRTNELGHTISLGAERFVRFQGEYFSYDRVFDQIHALGGVSGYAHSAMSFHGYRGLLLDVLAGKVDFLEVLQFCVPEGPLALEHYYRMLDLGCKLTALAGSDFPWCGRGRRPGEEQVGSQIGDARFYTYAGRPFSFEKWLEGVKAGRTFVTSGPMLEFEVNGQLPGSTLDLSPGAKVRLVARAHGQAANIPLARLQIVGHGKVLAEAKPGGAGQTLEQLALELELPLDTGIWLAARADAGVGQVAHTTPVYVTVRGVGFHHREKLAANLAIARRHLQEIRDLFPAPGATGGTAAGRAAPAPHQYPGAKDHLARRLAEAEARLAALER